jgi:hypothetical protein
VVRRAAFRFGFVLALLATFPFLLRFVPGGSWLIDLLYVPITWGVNALAALLGLPEPARLPTGSGDTLYHYLELLLFALVALVAAVTWARFDRSSDERRWRALRVLLRYWLAAVMCVYGVVKLFDFQFHLPAALVLDQRVGDKSPMGLLWLFMGHSRPYTMIAGGAELLACVLLLGRRTATLGALVGAIVMTNVVAMNFCYDVPVKLFSLEIIAAQLAVAAPDLRRMVGAALGHATREAPAAPRLSPLLERAGVIVKVLFVAILAWWMIVVATERWHDAPTELDGTWDVEHFATTAADERWVRFAVGDGFAVVRTSSERRVMYRATIDPATRAITLQRPIGGAGLLFYTWRDADHLALEGEIGGRAYTVTLARKQWLLETRGFHWIQEEPFHR